MTRLKTNIKSKIYCDNLKKVEFLETDNSTFLDRTRIHIWKLDALPFADEQLSWFVQHLSTLEQEKASRFRFHADRRRYILAHYYLKFLIAKYLKMPFWQIVIKPNEYKKPELAFNPTGLRFNLTHTQDHIFFAFRFDNNAIGIDMEKIDTAYNYKVIIRDYFTWEEETEILTKKSPALFFKLWTKKEALLKAIGTGLIDSMKDIQLLNAANTFEINDPRLLALGNPYYIKTLVFEQKYYISIAMQAPEIIPAFYVVDTD